MTVDGGAGNDIITTGVNNDTIIGGEGNDVIRGNAGADTVTVGAGNDVVQFAALTDSVANNNGFDTITDFKAAGTDVIQFVGLGVASLVNAPSQILGQNAVDALAATATVTQAATAYFGGAAVAANQAGFFTFQGNTYVVANDGAAAFSATTDLLVKINGVVALSASDFLLG